jgi:hypothetical protein
MRQSKRPAQRLSPGLAGGFDKPSTVTGTKSVRFPIVPSSDPEAPYGRDDKNNPIQPMRSDQDIAKGLLDNPHHALGTCPHKNDPNDCLLCGTKKTNEPTGPNVASGNQSVSRQYELVHAADVLTPEEIEERSRAALLENAERQFGIKPKTPIGRVSQASSLLDGHPESNTPQRQSSPSFHCYRELLGFERDHITRIFDLVVAYRRPPKPSEEMIQQLQKEISELDALILTRSAAWQKRNRPDDPLEKNDRERLKLEETKSRDKKKTELRALLKMRREYEETPPIPMTFEEKYHITHQRIEKHVEFVPDKLRTPEGQEPYYTEVLSKIETDIGGEYNIQGYRKMLRLGVEALAQADGLPLDGWVGFENKVILQAIKARLLNPHADLIQDYPALRGYQPPVVERETDDPEHQLIIKTGGAEIRGSVRGAGYGRALRDFAGTTGIRSGDGIGHSPDSPYVPDLSEDAESQNWD